MTMMKSDASDPMGPQVLRRNTKRHQGIYCEYCEDIVGCVAGEGRCGWCSPHALTDFVVAGRYFVARELELFYWKLVSLQRFGLVLLVLLDLGHQYSQVRPSLFWDWFSLRWMLRLRVYICEISDCQLIEYSFGAHQTPE